MTGADQEYRDLMHTARLVLSALSQRYDAREERAQTLSTYSLVRPSEVAAYFRPEMGSLEQEQFRVLMMDIKLRVIGSAFIYQGTYEQFMVRPAEVFREAVRVGAHAIVGCHNHPSGDATPSPDDFASTYELIDSGDILRIAVIDHIIVTATGHVSIREKRPALWERARTRRALEMSVQWNGATPRIDSGW